MSTCGCRPCRMATGAWMCPRAWGDGSALRCTDPAAMSLPSSIVTFSGSWLRSTFSLRHLHRYLGSQHLGHLESAAGAAVRRPRLAALIRRRAALPRPQRGTARGRRHGQGGNRSAVIPQRTKQRIGKGDSGNTRHRIPTRELQVPRATRMCLVAVRGGVVHHQRVA